MPKINLLTLGMLAAGLVMGLLLPHWILLGLIAACAVVTVVCWEK